MNTKKDILELIGEIYNTATLPKHQWGSFLKLMEISLDARSVTIFTQDRDELDGHVVASSSLAPHYLYWCDDYLGTVNTMLHRLSDLRQGMMITGEECIGGMPMAEHPGLDGFPSRNHAFHWTALVVKVTDETVDILMAVRDEATGPFDDQTLGICRLLAPHLGRAYRISEQLTTNQSHKTALAKMLDALPDGVMFIDDTLKVVELNRTARYILRSDDGVTLDQDGRLRVVSSTLRAKIGALLANVLLNPDLPTGIPGGVVAIPRPSGKRDYTVHVSPLRSFEETSDQHAPIAAVFLTDPEYHPTPPSKTLEARYGLTRSEANLALLLCQGKELRNAADELYVSMNTVRSHLKQIFSKTNTHRQGELIALLNRLPTSTRLFEN